MSETRIAPDLQVGAELRSAPRPLTKERIAWYSIGMLSAACGERQGVQHNIHTDDEYAKSQGLPGAIADGMHSTNWLSAMMTDYFGYHYLARGELRTKYIKPVYVDVTLTARGIVRSREEVGGGVRYEIDVWCEDDVGVKLTVGDAVVIVAAGSDAVLPVGSGGDSR